MAASAVSTAIENTARWIAQLRCGHCDEGAGARVKRVTKSEARCRVESVLAQCQSRRCLQTLLCFSGIV